MNLPILNLPQAQFMTKTVNGMPYIYDLVRKKFVKLTPEEWVRQNFIRFLSTQKHYPISLMAVEKQIVLNENLRRFDLVVYSRKGKPWAVAEFKAPEVKITQETFDQAVRYNMALFVDIILISNGLQHFVCSVDYPNKTVEYLDQVPDYFSAP